EPQRIGSDGRFYSPLVRSIAKEEGLSQNELESIEGSGQGGRVSKDDIMSYLDDRSSAPQKEEPKAADQQEVSGKKAEPKKQAPPQGKKRSIAAGELDIERPSEDGEVSKMDRMRKMIAKHIVKSKQTSGHVKTFGEVDVANLIRRLQCHKDE